LSGPVFSVFYFVILKVNLIKMFIQSSTKLYSPIKEYS
jgi:hypothetical protein